MSADVLGHNGTRMAALVYRHVLAPTVEAGAAPMQARCWGSLTGRLAPPLAPLGPRGQASGPADGGRR